MLEFLPIDRLLGPAALVESIHENSGCYHHCRLFRMRFAPGLLADEQREDESRVTNSYECALEVLRQRKSFHNRALERSESPAGPRDAAMSNERIVRPREDPARGEE